MGNTLSSWGGRKKVQGIITSSGLPLQIDGEGPEEDHKAPISPFTEAYDAKGWFTGVKSEVKIGKSPDVVYKSLSKDLQKVFSPITECDDEIEEEEDGKQVIFRVVRIPFKVAFVTGNLKLRLHVEQNSHSRQIHFESVKAGRLITRFVADFNIAPAEGSDGETVVSLDAKINAQSLPPPPFKGMVKDVMVRKMDSCMTDLVEHHSGPGEGGVILADGRAPSGRLHRKGSQGLLAAIRRSLGRRPSAEHPRAAAERAASAGPAGRRKSGRLPDPASASRRGSRSLDGKARPRLAVPEKSDTASSGQAAVFAEWQHRHSIT